MVYDEAHTLYCRVLFLAGRFVLAARVIIEAGGQIVDDHVSIGRLVKAVSVLVCAVLPLLRTQP